MSVNHVGPVLSAALVYGFGGLGLSALLARAIFFASKNRSEAVRSDASADVKPELVEGEAVLFGQVEYARDAERAVRVEIDQEGTETENSGVWSHKWAEKDRRVYVEPFYLRLASGARVQVKPTKKVFLVDEMDGIIRVDLTKRTRFAELSPGESIFAVGRLVRAPDPESTSAGGYRSGQDGWQLRARKGQPLLLSSQPLGDRFRGRARVHTSAATVLAAVLAIANLVFAEYHLRVFVGRTEEAHITKLDHYTTESDDTVYHHYRVWLLGADQGRFSDRVDDFVFPYLRVGDVVFVRKLPGAMVKSSTIGPAATASHYAFALPVLVLACWLFYRRYERGAQPWYERDLVDTGRGKLESTLQEEKARSARS